MRKIPTLNTSAWVLVVVLSVGLSLVAIVSAIEGR